MKKLFFTKLLIVCFLTYVAGLFLRFWELPLWLDASYWVAGEPLMATHDAYAWMAGAKGAGRLVGRPMSELLAGLHALTGLNVGVINFWLPAICAPLAAIPVCLLCAYWRRPEAGLAAGVMASGSLGFLLRTRLGFGDTDILTLFLPLLFVAALVYWLTPFLSQNWGQVFPFRKPSSQTSKKKNADAPERELLFSGPRFYWAAFGAGLIFLAYSWFYPNAYPIAMYVLITAVGVACLLNRSLPWQDFWAGLAVVLALGKLGWVGLIIGGGITWLGLQRPDIIRTRFTGTALLAGVLVLFPVFHGAAVVTKLIEPALSYAKINLSRETESLLKLPTVKQSIREAQNIDWLAIMDRLAGHWALFIPALLGTAWMVIKRPLALSLLPLLGLSILSFKLGNRFAMYGGPVLGLGLGFGTVSLLSTMSSKRTILWFGALCVAFVASCPLSNTADMLRPGPVIPKIYAQTFMELAENTPQDAQLWQWWDYGYAAQYYAQRRSFGDGGAHSGPHLYPLAKIHSTNSPAKAAQLMRLIGAHGKEQRLECQHNGTKPQNPGASVLYYPTKPLAPLEAMGPEKAQDFVDTLDAGTDLTLPEQPDPQYFVLSWENLRLAYWITYFGNWNLETGNSFHGRVQRVRRQAQFDLQQGVLQTTDRQVPLVSLDVIDESGRNHRSWPNSGNIHAVLNQLSRELYIMDDTVYNSLLVQMLIGESDQFAPHFELVQDRFPWTRVYRVSAADTSGQ
ncbi:Oligosaccharyl transferase STT3 subunit [Desulfohalobium retbaense DSM 5692]|uniref:Oligosaccharyl transferase STT3 subunit n=2 Tax=Desulfohalobium TaxID=45662 RepID=C8WZW2_DESRD|nr:Oligosaccharyl transferase STT3 subunit [Desulfohalobium retbaense DSM 5692]